MIVDPKRFVKMTKRFADISMAVRPVDFTRDGLIVQGRIDISLDKSSSRPARTPTGFYNFFYLPVQQYNVTIRSDFYLDKVFLVSLPRNGMNEGDQTVIDSELTLTALANGLLADLNLIPSAIYPFPAGATMIQGEVIEVIDGRKVPVEATDIQVSGSGANTLNFRSDEQGKFVLYCNRIRLASPNSTAVVVDEINGRAFGGGLAINLQITDTAGRTVQQSATIIDNSIVLLTVTMA